MPKFSEISDAHHEFITKQKMFFVGTAAPEGRVNIAPKDMESLCVMGPNRIVWRNLRVPKTRLRRIYWSCHG